MADGNLPARAGRPRPLDDRAPQAPPGLLRALGRPNVAAYLREDALVRKQIENYQTKIFAMSSTDNVNRPYPVDEGVFARAVETLMSVDCVGLTEHFQDSVSAFERLSGIHCAAGTLHANRSRKGYAPSEEDIAAIRALVPYDLRLYEIAPERLLAKAGQAAAPAAAPDAIPEAGR